MSFIVFISLAEQIFFVFALIDIFLPVFELPCEH